MLPSYCRSLNTIVWMQGEGNTFIFNFQKLGLGFGSSRRESGRETKCTKFCGYSNEIRKNLSKAWFRILIRKKRMRTRNKRDTIFRLFQRNSPKTFKSLVYMILIRKKRMRTRNKIDKILRLFRRNSPKSLL